MFNLFNGNKLISFHRNPYSRLIFRTSRITSTIYFYSCVYFCSLLLSFCLHPLFPNISVQLLNRRVYGVFCWKESPFTFRKCIQRETLGNFSSLVFTWIQYWNCPLLSIQRAYIPMLFSSIALSSSSTGVIVEKRPLYFSAYSLFQSTGTSNIFHSSKSPCNNRWMSSLLDACSRILSYCLLFCNYKTFLWFVKETNYLKPNMFKSFWYKEIPFQRRGFWNIKIIKVPF